MTWSVITQSSDRIGVANVKYSLIIGEGRGRRTYKCTLCRRNLYGLTTAPPMPPISDNFFFYIASTAAACVAAGLRAISYYIKTKTKSVVHAIPLRYCYYCDSCRILCTYMFYIGSTFGHDTIILYYNKKQYSSTCTVYEHIHSSYFIIRI